MSAIVPICRNCHRAIWEHVYGTEVIWRHFNGLILCQPDESNPEFTGVEGAIPMTEAEYAEEVKNDHQA